MMNDASTPKGPLAPGDMGTMACDPPQGWAPAHVISVAASVPTAATRAGRRTSLAPSRGLSEDHAASNRMRLSGRGCARDLFRVRGAIALVGTREGGLRRVVEIAARRGLKVEVAERVDSSHEHRGRLDRGAHVPHVSRDVADPEANPAPEPNGSAASDAGSACGAARTPRRGAARARRACRPRPRRPPVSRDSRCARRPPRCAAAVRARDCPAGTPCSRSRPSRR